MASTDHCRNILSPTFSYVGTGVTGHTLVGVTNGAGTWTRDFGLPIDRTTAASDEEAEALARSPQ